jgi:hypothetical protein
VRWGRGTRMDSQRAGSMKQMSSQMKDIRAQMEEDEDLNTLMRGLRGQGMNEDDFAAVDTKMRLIEVSDSAIDGSTDSLPLVGVSAAQPTAPRQTNNRGLFNPPSHHPTWSSEGGWRLAQLTEAGTRDDRSTTPRPSPRTGPGGRAPCCRELCSCWVCLARSSPPLPLISHSTRCTPPLWAHFAFKAVP